MKFALSIAVLVLIASTNVASAQRDYSRWGGGGYHSSTAEEGIQRGFADIVRSAGMKNLMDSEAAINYEDARKKYIDNRMHYTQTYFQMRAVNRQARAAERGPRPSQEDLIRFAANKRPNRLGNRELDPLSGEIAWPVLLLKDEFAEEREQLDELYVDRAVNGSLTADQIIEVDNLVKGLEAVMKYNIREYSPQLYTQAKSFLRSLSYESFQRPG